MTQKEKEIDRSESIDIHELRERLQKEGKEIILAAPQLYIDVDVEADGKPGHGNMLSIGAQSPTGESFYSEIRPVSDTYVLSQRQFCEEHGLQRDRLLEDAPDFRQVMEGFSEWTVGLKAKYKKDPIFTAFNASFDYSFVDLYFVKAGLENPYGIAPFDLKSAAIQLTGREWDFRKTAKNQLPEEIVPPEEFSHNALEDAQYQQKLHFGMAALLAKSNAG